MILSRPFGTAVNDVEYPGLALRATLHAVPFGTDRDIQGGVRLFFPYRDYLHTEYVGRQQLLAFLCAFLLVVK